MCRPWVRFTVPEELAGTSPPCGTQSPLLTSIICAMRAAHSTVLRLSSSDCSRSSLPERTLRRAALLLLDTLGICAAATSLEPGAPARRVAARLFGATDDRYAARILFDGQQVSLAGAVFASATQIDNLDGHDGYQPTKGHIGVVAVPTLAALAEHRPDLTGPRRSRPSSWATRPPAAPGSLCTPRPGLSRLGSLEPARGSRHGGPVATHERRSAA